MPWLFLFWTWQQQYLWLASFVDLALAAANSSRSEQNELEQAAWRKADAIWATVPFNWPEFNLAYHQAVRLREHSKQRIGQ